MNILRIEGLTKSYGANQVLKGLNLTISSPDIYALVGPNGSGKTTLIEIICHLNEADGGSIQILGIDHKSPRVFQQMSVLLDQQILYPYLNGYDHLGLIRSLHGISEKKMDEVIRKVGIESYLYKKVSKLSLGMAQHLLIAMALLSEPKLLILDEPLNGLDPDSVIKMRELLLELKEKGSTVIFSSHGLSEIDKITSQILFLVDGVIVGEDLSSLQSVSYQLELSSSPSGEARSLLDAREDKQWLFREGETKLPSLLKLLSKEEVEILSIKKMLTGSEERYRELFSKRSADQS